MEAWEADHIRRMSEMHGAHQMRLACFRDVAGLLAKRPAADAEDILSTIMKSQYGPETAPERAE